MLHPIMCQIITRAAEIVLEQKINTLAKVISTNKILTDGRTDGRHDGRTDKRTEDGKEGRTDTKTDHIRYYLS